MYNATMHVKEQARQIIMLHKKATSKTYRDTKQSQLSNNDLIQT